MLRKFINLFKKRWYLSVIVLLVVVATVIYANSFTNEFLYDDRGLIIKNTYIRSWQYLPRIFTTAISGGSSADEPGNFYRPVQVLTYLVDYSLWKLNPTGYHLTNLLLHLFNSLLIYSLVYLMFNNKGISLITSLFFVVHPIHTEAVTYISGRADLLYTFFSLLSFLLYIKYVYCVRKAKRLYCYLGSAFCFALALLSKEAAIAFPLIFLLYDFTFSSKTDRLNSKRNLYRRYLPFLLIIIAYILLRTTVLEHSPRLLLTQQYNLYLRLLTTSRVIISYIRLLIFPFNLHMEYLVWPAGSLFEPRILGSVAFLILLFIIMLRSFKHTKTIFFSSAWFFLTLLPVSNIVPLNAFMAEHWLYLPSVGFFIILAVGIRKLWTFEFWRRWIVFLIIPILVFYSTLTIRQNKVWKNAITFFQYTLKYAPNRPRLHFNLGIVYYERGLNDNAIEEYKKALQLNPAYVAARNNLGIVYEKLGMNEEAIIEYKKAIELNPTHSNSHNNLGGIYLKKGKYNEAIEEFILALKKGLRDSEIWTNLGDAYQKAGLFEEASIAYRKALNLNPRFVKVYINLGANYIKMGEYKKAIEEYKTALQLTPNLPEIYFNLGIAYAKMREFRRARESWEKALEINPNLKSAQENLEGLEQMEY